MSETSIQDWFTADGSRVNIAAHYDATDITTLFQDSAGTTPVVSDGDPVRLILNVAGNTDFDQVILAEGTPATYRQRGGVGCVELSGGAALRSRVTVTLAVPLFVAVGHSWRTTALKPMLGVTRAGTAYLQVTSPMTTQHRPTVITHNGLFGGGYNPLEGSELGQAPFDAPMVGHASFLDGTHDVAVNSLQVTSEANTWDILDTTVGAYIGIGMSTNVSSASTEGDFYNGFVLFDDVASYAGLRDDAVCDLRAGIVKPSLGADRNILVLGDSTGDALNESGGVFTTNGEFAYRLALHLASLDGTAFIEIRTFETQYEYRPPVIVQDGSGPVIRIWNGSISGSQEDEHMGVNFQKQVRDVPTADTVIINNGYNSAQAGNPVNSYEATIMSLVEQVKPEHPGAHWFFIRQPPSILAGGAPTTYMDDWVLAVDSIAAMYGADTVDVHADFDSLTDGQRVPLYADLLHPNDAGVDQWVLTTNPDLSVAPSTHGAGFALIVKPNLLADNGFESFPAGWTTSGPGTVSKTASEVDADFSRTDSLTIADTGAQSTYIEQQIDAGSVQGQTVTLSVRQFIEADYNPIVESRISISSDGTGTPSSSVDTYSKSQGGWQWNAIQLDVPGDATTITVRLYGRESGTGALTAHYGFATLVAGSQMSALAAESSGASGTSSDSGCCLLKQSGILSRSFGMIDDVVTLAGTKTYSTSLPVGNFQRMAFVIRSLDGLPLSGDALPKVTVEVGNGSDLSDIGVNKIQVCDTLDLTVLESFTQAAIEVQLTHIGTAVDQKIPAKDQGSYQNIGLSFETVDASTFEVCYIFTDPMFDYRCDDHFNDFVGTV